MIVRTTNKFLSRSKIHPAEHDDMRQEIVLRVWNLYKREKITILSPGNIWKAAIYFVADFNRAKFGKTGQKRIPKVSMDAAFEAGTRDKPAFSNDLIETALRNFNRLNPRTSEIFFLMARGLSAEQVARALNYNPSAITISLQKCKPLLKRCILQAAG